MSAAPLHLSRSRAALLVVDIQERLAAVMPAARLAEVERNVGILLEAARRLGLPVVVSEQYPRGLGPTVSSLAAALDAPEGFPGGLHRLTKLDFGVCAAPEFAPVWTDVARDQWIVAGMETHVCVYQSVRQLAERAAAVHVPRDAVISRTDDNRAVGLDLCARAGGIVTATEVVVFDLLERAGTDDFKALSRLVK